jgi:hypothetical protein
MKQDERTRQLIDLVDKMTQGHDKKLLSHDASIKKLLHQIQEIPGLHREIR